MKYTSQGGYVQINDSRLYQLTSWTLTESEGDVVGTRSTKTDGTLAFFYDHNDLTQRVFVSDVVNIKIIPAVGANVMTLEECFVTNFSRTGTVNAINTASISFISQSAIQ